LYPVINPFLSHCRTAVSARPLAFAYSGTFISLIVITFAVDAVNAVNATANVYTGTIEVRDIW
jgi:hypothetical protein